MRLPGATTSILGLYRSIGLGLLPGWGWRAREDCQGSPAFWAGGLQAKHTGAISGFFEGWVELGRRPNR